MPAMWLKHVPNADGVGGHYESVENPEAVRAREREAAARQRADRRQQTIRAARVEYIAALPRMRSNRTVGEMSATDWVNTSLRGEGFGVLSSDEEAAVTTKVQDALAATV